MIQVSRAVRVEAEAALANFTATLLTACTTFGITSQAFSLTPGTNYWLAPFSLDDLKERVAVNNWPCMTVSTGRSVDSHEQLVCTFEGPVELRVSVFYRWQFPSQLDMQSLPEAVESTLLTLLTPINGLMQGSLTIEKDPPEWDNDSWYMGQHLTADYLVTA